MSFSLYVTHVPSLYLFRSLFQEGSKSISPMAVYLATAFSLIIAYIFYFFIESKIQRFFNK